MKLKEENIDYLKFYTDLKNESSFSGIDNFYKSIKKIYPKAKSKNGYYLKTHTHSTGRKQTSFLVIR